MFQRCFVFIVLLLIFTTPTHADYRLALDSTGAGGGFTSLAIAPNGFPIISYHTSSDLKLAICNNTTCSSPTLQTLDSTGEVGRYTSIAIAPNGFPVISYYDSTNLDLKLAICNDSTCNAPTLRTLDSTGHVGLYTSVAIAPSGFPMVSYYDSSNGDLKLAICNNNTCTVPILRTLASTGDVGWDTSITMPSSGFPVVSYYDATNNSLNLAVCTDTTCTAPTLRTVDNSGVTGYTSIALAPNGFPVISYHASTDLKLAVCSNISCSAPTLRTIDSAGIVGINSSIAIASSGFPVISYYDGSTDDLKLAVCTDSNCTAPTLRLLDNAGLVGLYSSIAVTSGGFPVISYQDSTNQNLKLIILENLPPTLNPVASQTVRAGEMLTFSLSASNLDNAPAQQLTYNMNGAGITGATLGSSTGTFTWTPTDAQTGTHLIKFTVTDNGVPAKSDSQIGLITVESANDAPVLALLGNQNVRAGETLAFNVAATDANVSQTLTYSMTSLTGATLDSATGAFSWTPTDAQIGAHSIEFTVMDNGVPAKNDSQIVTISVESGNDAPVLAFITDQNALIGETISFSISATDANAGQTLTYTMSGNIPTGATFTDGQFNWATNAVGLYNVTFTVTDNGVPSLSDSQTVSLLVRSPTNTAPQFADAPDYVGVKGDNINLNLSAADVDPDQIVTYGVTGSLPQGATLDTQTGMFSWTAAPAGLYSLTFTAHDNGVPALSATETVQFAIDDQLALNSGFEEAGAKPKVGDIWKGVNLSKDKRLCTGIGANGSLCAFRFKGSATENSKVKQTLAISWLDIGDTVVLSALFKPTNIPDNSRVARVKIVYLDGTKALLSLRLGGTSDSYLPLSSEPLTVEKDVRKLQVFIEYRGVSGSFYVDDVRVTVASSGSDPTRD